MTMGKMQRTKGAAFERWLVRLFKEELPGPDWKRGLQSRGGGAEVPDVDGPMFHVEAKHQIRPNITKALEQACRDNGNAMKLPVAVTKANQCQPIVSMLLCDWLKLARAYKESLDGRIDLAV